VSELGEDEVTPVLSTGRLQKIEDRLAAIEQTRATFTQAAIGLALATAILIGLVVLVAAVLSEVHR
jgi:hypothetical protein